jgi:UDP-N-acetyl-2-amino-2-deoxyglucuronate dehydrogenase
VSSRIGILGAGQAGERQALGFSSLGGVEVVGVADVVRSRAEALAARVGGRAVDDLGGLLRLGLDVLVVATPHALHVEPAERAASAGVHVMMEKPLATTLEDARRIVEVCAEADVRLATSFVHRFREESRRAKRWLEGSGRPLLARETQNGRITASHPAWLTSSAMAGGGVLMYSAIHGVDRLRWLLGSEITRVTAATAAVPADAEVETYVALHLAFANGAVATLTAASPRFPPEPTLWETEVFTDRAMVRLRTRVFAETSSDERQERYDAADDPETSFVHYNFARQGAEMLQAIAERRAPEADGIAGLHALEVCLAAYRSATDGRTVVVGVP